jgi:putative ABC transport system permease protein
MGRLLLVFRLAVKDIRHRPVLAALLLVAIAAGATTLTLGLTLRGTANNPYTRARAATSGPDVVATDFSGDPQAPAQVGDLVPFEQAPGVVAHSGPFPVSWTSLETGRTRATAVVEGRSSAPSAVDQPKLTLGTWIRPGGVVVEAGFADALGLHVGERLSLGSSWFEVVGIAVTAAFPSYPESLDSFLVGRLGSYSLGLVWVPEADVAPLAAAGSEPAFYYMDLRLADPAAAQAFADRYTTGSSSQQTAGPSAQSNANAPTTALTLYAWQRIRSEDAQILARAQVVLFTGSWLLALMALSSVAVLVGGRMADQTRRVGLLKAVGGTPRFVAVVLVCEHALIGLCAAGVGLLAGWLAAPLIAGPGLLGAPNAPSLTLSSIGLVVALALGVAVAATFLPAIRAARQSTVAALDDFARAPRRRSRVMRLSAHLPVTLLLGVRLAVRRPRRLLLSACSVAVMASGLVAVLVVRTTAEGVSPGPRVTQAIAVISVMLVVLAAIDAVFIAWSSALDIRHPAALARALGATRQQLTAGLSVALALPALFGALLGIPGGILIYGAPKHSGSTTIPSALSLAVMVIVTVLVIAVLTAVPVSIGARRPVAEVLESETN